MKTAERVAVLETEMRANTAILTTLVSRVEAIDKDLIRYRGLWGGVMLVMSAIGAALLLLKDQILSAFSGLWR